MAIKVLIRREVAPGNERKAQDLLLQLRSRAMEEPGYISGETLVDNENPHAMVVISTWYRPSDWRHWHDSEARKSLDRELEPLLTAAEEVQVLRERQPEGEPTGEG